MQCTSRYSLRVTESTIKNIRALNGVLVQIAKPLGMAPYLLGESKLWGVPQRSQKCIHTEWCEEGRLDTIIEVPCSPVGNNVTSNLKWDLGGRNVTAGLLKVLKFSQGRFLELGGQYSDKTQLLTLEAAGKPHKDHRLAAA